MHSVHIEYQFRLSGRSPRQEMTTVWRREGSFQIQPRPGWGYWYANIPCIPCLQWTLYRQLFFTRFWVFNFVLFFTSSVARRVHLQRRFESVVKVFSCLKEMDFSSCRLLFECLHSIWKFRFNRPNRISAVKVSYSCFSTSFSRASNTISFASTIN